MANNNIPTEFAFQWRDGTWTIWDENELPQVRKKKGVGSGFKYLNGNTGSYETPVSMTAVPPEITARKQRKQEEIIKSASAKKTAAEEKKEFPAHLRIHQQRFSY